MAVPVYQRKQSSMEFLNAAMQMVELCTSILAKIPQKYKYPFEQIVNMSYDALYHINLANEVHFRKASLTNDYLYRRNNFTYGKAMMQSIGFIIETNLNICEINNVIKKKSIMFYRSQFARIIATCTKTINGALNKDQKRYLELLKTALEDGERMIAPGMITLPVGFPVPINGCGFNTIEQYKGVSPLETKNIENQQKSANIKISMCRIVEK